MSLFWVHTYRILSLVIKFKVSNFEYDIALFSGFNISIEKPSVIIIVFCLKLMLLFLCFWDFSFFFPIVLWDACFAVSVFILIGI